MVVRCFKHLKQFKHFKRFKDMRFKEISTKNDQSNEILDSYEEQFPQQTVTEVVHYYGTSRANIAHGKLHSVSNILATQCSLTLCLCASCICHHLTPIIPTLSVVTIGDQ